MSVQANHQANYLRKTPRMTILPPYRREPEHGAITQRFFAEGEAQAANGYKNLEFYNPADVGVDDEKSAAAAVRDRELEFDSFDEAPKRRRPLVGIALVMSGAAVMVAAWTVSTTGVPWGWSGTKTVVVPAPAAMAAIPAPASTPARQSAVVEPIRSAVIEPIKTRPAAPSRTRRDDPEDVQASHRPRPMRGYVWSPVAKAMVSSESSASAIPAGTAERDPAASASTATTSTPAVAPAPGLGALPTVPKIAPPDTGPPPFESARVPVPVDGVPILE